MSVSSQVKYSAIDWFDEEDCEFIEYKEILNAVNV